MKFFSMKEETTKKYIKTNERRKIWLQKNNKINLEFYVDMPA